jgi:hypothetical protein
MPITVECKCGKSFSARDELAGGQGKCPSCGRVVEIPAEISTEKKGARETEDLQDIFSRARIERKGQDLVFAEYCFYRKCGYTEENRWHISRHQAVQNREDKTARNADMIIGKKVSEDGFVPIILVEVGSHYNEEPSHVLMRALGLARAPYFEPALPLVAVGNGEKHIMFNTLTEAPFPEILPPEEAAEWRVSDQPVLGISVEPLDYLKVLKRLLHGIPESIDSADKKGAVFDPHEYEENLLGYYSISSLDEINSWDAEAEVKRFLGRYKWEYSKELFELCKDFAEAGYPEIRELQEIELEKERLLKFAAVNDKERKYRCISWVVEGLFFLLIAITFRRTKLLALGALIMTLISFAISYVYFILRRGTKPIFVYYDLDTFLSRWAKRSRRLFNVLYIISAIIIIALLSLVLL